MRLQHTSADAHLSVLHRATALLINTRTNRMTSKGIPVVANSANEAKNSELPLTIIDVTNRERIVQISTIEVIASLRIAERWRCATSGISTIFWKGRSWTAIIIILAFFKLLVL